LEKTGWRYLGIECEEESSCGEKERDIKWRGSWFSLRR